MDTQEVVWHPKTKKLAQIPKEGLEYAFVSEGFEQIHQLVWCKDFLQDALQGFLNNKKVEIYGFSYNPKTDIPLYMRKTRLMLSNWKDEEFPQRIENMLEFINQIEARLSMWKTIAVQCWNPPPIYKRSGVFVLDGSPRWMKSPPMISMYSLLLRIGLVHQSGDSFETTFKKVKSGETPSYYGGKTKDYEDKTSDQRQLSGATVGINWVLKHSDRQLFYPDIKKNYPPELGTSTLHNTYGIVGFSKKQTEKQFPYWHRLQESKT